ncbi:GrpB family protein [Aquiflexum sp.]|uniref:GrpB family protein n=1 Tax=Aquiflexum sp. TaxID=1872584 RepID=UPI003593913E
MKIDIVPYDKNWVTEFGRLKVELSKILGKLSPSIEHIGSTSVPGLAAKNVIDVLVGLEESSQFDFVTNELAQNDRYIYYKAFEAGLPNRRLFVRLKDGESSAAFEKVFLHQEKIPHEAIQKSRLANVHVVENDSSEWLRHIAFREYLKVHEEVRLEYAKIKADLSQKTWEHGMKYNEGKDSFIKREEKNAVEWYLSAKK